MIVNVDIHRCNDCCKFTVGNRNKYESDFAILAAMKIRDLYVMSDPGNKVAGKIAEIIRKEFININPEVDSYENY